MGEPISKPVDTDEFTWAPLTDASLADGTLGPGSVIHCPDRGEVTVGCVHPDAANRTFYLHAKHGIAGARCDRHKDEHGESHSWVEGLSGAVPRRVRVRVPRWVRADTSGLTLRGMLIRHAADSALGEEDRFRGLLEGGAARIACRPDGAAAIRLAADSYEGSAYDAGCQGHHGCQGRRELARLDQYEVKLNSAPPITLTIKPTKRVNARECLCDQAGGKHARYCAALGCQAGKCRKPAFATCCSKRQCREHFIENHLSQGHSIELVCA